MSDPLIISIIAGVTTVIGSILAYLGAKIAGEKARITMVEERALKAERVNHGMWIWNRSLQDQIYRRAAPPPTEPPDWLKDLIND